MEIDRDEKLKDICNTIVLEYPEAIGVAFIALDCGCIHYCGVSFSGDPVGIMQTLSGPPDAGAGESPICFQCYRKNTLDMTRVVRRGILWPGEASELPGKDLRIFVGQTVFGEDYDETDG